MHIFTTHTGGKLSLIHKFTLYNFPDKEHVEGWLIIMQLKTEFQTNYHKYLAFTNLLVFSIIQLFLD